MHDLAVGALAIEQELNAFAGGIEFADAVEGVEGPEGVAAEEPAEAGADGVPGAEESGGEAFFLVIGCGFNAELIDGDFGPGEGIV